MENYVITCVICISVLFRIQNAAAEYAVFLPAIQNVLTGAYKMFRLFFGEFSCFRSVLLFTLRFDLFVHFYYIFVFLLILPALP